jgi:hypothetical protein
MSRVQCRALLPTTFSREIYSWTVDILANFSAPLRRYCLLQQWLDGRTDQAAYRTPIPSQVSRAIELDLTKLAGDRSVVRRVKATADEAGK